MPTIQIKSKTPHLLYWKLVFEGVLRDSILPEPINVEGDPDFANLQGNLNASANAHADVKV